VVDEDDHDTPVALGKSKVLSNVKPLVVVLLLDLDQVACLAIDDFVVEQRRRDSRGRWEQNTAEVSLLPAAPSNGEFSHASEVEELEWDYHDIGFHNGIPFFGLGLNKKFYHEEFGKYATDFSGN
jgi:hypothetical protein